MKESEIVLAVILIVLIIWLALREPAQTIIVFMPLGQRSEVEKAPGGIAVETAAKPKFHGFAMA